MRGNRKAIALAAPLALTALAFLAPAAAQTASEAPVAAALLPKDLSPWGMFLSADIFVKAVMIVLASASLITWTVALVKAIELIAGSRKLRGQLGVLERSTTIAEAVAALAGGGALEAAAREAQAEMRVSAGLDASGLKERVVSRLERAEAHAGRRMARATGLLATIGATAPFVGLFGTVWGVMNSFIGISKQHTTNLAVVAPGIAEALFATAIGLGAAIPAVLAYNQISNSLSRFAGRLDNFGSEFSAILSRQSEERS